MIESEHHDVINEIEAAMDTLKDLLAITRSSLDHLLAELDKDEPHDR